MKQTKKGGGTLREYRVFGYRVTVESFKSSSPKVWAVTLHRLPTVSLPAAQIWADPLPDRAAENGATPAPITT